uniref:very-long-chain enoyl-CoA reductase n=1 Tax=Strigamia maritima TaxID=126957 RepID=T1J5Q0_STRMM
MEIEILATNTGKSLAIIQDLQPSSTIYDVKKKFSQFRKQYYPERQAFKTDKKGKTLNDDEKLDSLRLTNGSKLYFKDLGPQIGWTTVFLTEYAGPLLVYLWFYTRPAFIYGAEAAKLHTHTVVHIAAGCWSFHYVKRLLETVFVHRFSHSTMPILNIFKNSAYYWGFAAYVAYYINHPLYTAPGCYWHIYSALAAFVVCELGNFSVHIALRNLRPPGTKVRKIPQSTGNPLTFLFNFVSCPNYTYESGSWLAFTVMTQSGFFALAGFYQMTLWALGKHRNYKKEFSNYPKKRRAIVPFVI